LTCPCSVCEKSLASCRRILATALVRMNVFITARLNNGRNCQSSRSIMVLQ
jgi:hypothetical protein